MHLFGLNRRRSETLLLVIGQLVLIAYVFQVAAFDHWGSGEGVDFASLNVMGIEGNSTHVSAHRGIHDDHCHGGPSTCAEAGGGVAHFSPNQAIQLPSSSPSLVLDMDSSMTAPLEPLIAALPEPPQAVA